MSLCKKAFLQFAWILHLLIEPFTCVIHVSVRLLVQPGALCCVSDLFRLNHNSVSSSASFTSRSIESCEFAYKMPFRFFQISHNSQGIALLLLNSDHHDSRRSNNIPIFSSKVIEKLSNSSGTAAFLHTSCAIGQRNGTWLIVSSPAWHNLHILATFIPAYSGDLQLALPHREPAKETF